MQADWTGSFVLFLVLALLATMLFMFLCKRNTQSIAQVRAVFQQNVKALEVDVPKRIVIGENPDQPFVTIEALPSTHKYELAKPLDTQSSTSISRLNVLYQALPSLLVAGEASGKRLMEVVINGDLVRAADGNGLRAFTMTAADGIKENARLFEVSNLKNMINAAAIWQIASVVVAQKHLADITKKLDEIKGGVLRISRFLDNQRKSRIRSTYEYLGQIHQAIQGGDLPSTSRSQLEHCERDLLEIQHHLQMEYRQMVDDTIEHKETFGTETLMTDIAKKVNDLDLLIEDIALCIKTRIAAWHVLSLFPGEPKLKLARRVSIQESIESFQSLGPYCEKKLKHEISGVDAFWNFEDTLNERRISLTKKCDSTVQTLSQKTQQVLEVMERSDQLMLEHDLPTCILLQFDNGALVGTRQG